MRTLSQADEKIDVTVRIGVAARTRAVENGESYAGLGPKRLAQGRE
jgi:hypothetical protein